MKIYFLGTNGWYSTKTGNTLCTLIKTKRFSLILDAGDSFYKLKGLIDEKKPTFLFLSHTHLDHIYGLHMFNQFKFKKLHIFCPQGAKKSIKTILSKPYTQQLETLPFEIKFKELKEGYYKKPLNFDCKRLIHPIVCYGYRFEIDGKKIAYCTDTGECENLKRLIKNADLAILECGYKAGEQSTKWPHLNPETASSIAKKCNVKRLILTHFDAKRYENLRERKKAELFARKIFRNTKAARDSMSFIL